LQKNTKSKKILYIGIGKHSGGPIISLIQLIKNLDTKKYTPIVFSIMNPHEKTYNKLKNLNIRIVKQDIWINNWLNSKLNKNIFHLIKAPGRFLRLLYNSILIYKIIKKENIDIVHSNIELYLEGAIAAWLSDKPHIWHIRAPIGSQGAVKHIFGDKFMFFIINFFSTKIIVNSHRTKNSLKKYISEKKIHLIYNGIDIEDFVKNKHIKGKLRNIFGIDNSKKIVASIGYLSEIKGGKEFVEIAKYVCNFRNDVVFIWIGPSLEQKNDLFTTKIFEYIKKNNLIDKIFFTGERDDINILLNDVDIFLQPMINGSWSRVVLEAMASSLPVIAIETNMQSEIIKNEETGFLVKNVKEASLKILELLDNFEKRKLIGENAFKFVKGNFTNQITAKKVMKLYDEVLDNKEKNEKNSSF